MTHAVDAMEDPLIGKVLSGRFEILAPLGAGGMGRVYKARQHPIDRLVALKVLNPRYDGAKDPGFERRFFLEASMTAKLKHPNTITVHDYGRTDDGIYFLAMEFLEGETLAQLLRRGALPWQRALVIGGQIARSLREAHRLGMVHRDLKPANVMLLREGTGGDVVKVLDFGLVKSLQAEKKPPSDDEEEPGELTQAGVLLGSPLYMAPEQAKSEVDVRTDIYSLGTVLFQCIAGRTPFQGRESIDIIVKQIRETPPQLRSLVPGVPSDVNALVMRCLEKEPAARFQTMDELLAAMRVATAGQGLSGVFADPRSTSGVISGVDSGVMASAPIEDPSSPTRAYDASTPHSVAIELSGPSVLVAKSSRWKAPLLSLAALAMVGLGFAAYRVLRPAPLPPPVVVPPVAPPVAPVVVAPPPVVTPPPPVAVEVTFRIESEPAGATVLRDGQALGTTPFSLTISRSSDAPARAELTFELAGYEPAGLVAMGSEGTVPVMQTLKKAAPPPVVKPPPTKKPPVKKPPPGFKDDPYQ